ncbi:MAG: pentapeptide repeat-containing protein, partial [Paracoccaceae bacterium]
VRIGAILSLERIAQDSTAYDKGRDHVRVMEILCAYVRENAPAKEAKEDLAGPLGPPKQDISQALKVIGRRSVEQRLVEAAWPKTRDTATVWPFDLPCPKLPEINDDATRSDAEIAAYVSELNDWLGTLRAYSGYRLDLRGVNLQRAELSAKAPDQSDAVFSGALLIQARLEWADLSRARLEGVDLFGARTQGAILTNARMEGACLTLAMIEGTDFRRVRMEGADLNFARMDGRTILYGAVFQGSGARDVNYSNVRVTADQITSMFGDGSVILPEGMARPAHWPEGKLDWDDFQTEWRNWQADPEQYRPPAP